ncbi:MAG: hypothetical protein ACOCZ5_00415 [bacterium]
MENNVKKALNNFVDEEEINNQKNQGQKKKVLDERSGLIERVDRVYVTNDGRQLLREQY